MAKKTPNKKMSVETITHVEASRKNIPTAEYESVMQKDEQSPIRMAYERRNRDLDPQLVWRGKDEQDWSDLVVYVPPLYIQEKVHPKVLIDDLLKRSRDDAKASEAQIDLFADFNGLPNEIAKTEFYQHDANWSNRMILGDSLQVMASLAKREGLRGKVQCIYLDPPYGIKFNSNFQWSTTSRDVTDGKIDHITREPEQVKAFRDTWRDGIHSYLTYLRDRLTVARELLTDSGSIFVQIGDENVHRIRALLDEVFGESNFCGQISFRTTGGQSNSLLASSFDILLWYACNKNKVKYRSLYSEKPQGAEGSGQYVLIEHADGLLPPISMTPAQKEGSESLPEEFRVLAHDTLYSSGSPSEPKEREYCYQGRMLTCPSNNHWKPGGRGPGMHRLYRANRFLLLGNTLRYKRYWHDFRVRDFDNLWVDTGRSGFADKKKYVVETSPRVIERCILMTSDSGDLVLDPTCGSGTTAFVAEQWGRRWITIDTSRVALALARARIMGARYAYYLLADSPQGRRKEAELSGKWFRDSDEEKRTTSHQKPATSHYSLRQGFVYERVPHITLKSIANNAEIDVIWERWQNSIAPLLEQLSAVIGDQWPVASKETSHEAPTTGNSLAEWEVPREFPNHWPTDAKYLHTEFWKARIARQHEIDASIAAKAEFEYLYDKPYEDKKTVRVAGPFTVESLSPHRVLAVDENDELIDTVRENKGGSGEAWNFAATILENLKTAGVQQAHKDDKIVFTSLTPWPGRFICAEGRFEVDSEEWLVTGVQEKSGECLVAGHEKQQATNHQTLTTSEKRAAIFVGPEFGTVSRIDLVEAAREAGDADFDVLITCAFNYDAHSSEFNKLGRIPVLKARMNADLHMADDLKNTGKGNLFVIFGEPDIGVLETGNGQIQVKINGVDVFHPTTGEVRPDGPEGIACWFIDTDYNEESFFVRHAYFLGANDPYKSLKTTLKAEINEEAWNTLNSDTSRPFDKPRNGRIAVKVINHLGDEVMKVFRIL